MEGLAKTADIAVQVAHIPEPSTTGLQQDIPTLPTDMYRHFNLDWATPEKEINKLQDIYKWASDKAIKNDELTLGNVMMNIRQLEMKLGVPTNGQPMYDKLWNWIKLENNIEDIRKRQAAI